MREYHKINSIYKRNEKKQFILGQYSEPVFEYLANNEWIFTEKVDGTNIRIDWDGTGVVNYGGRTDNASIPAPLVNRLREIFQDVSKWTPKFAGTPVTLYGEGYGAKIQKGGGNYKPDGVDFVLFDVLIGQWWLERSSIEDIAQHFGVKIVPIIGYGTLNTAIEKVSSGLKSQWGDFLAEGIVARPRVELKQRNGDRIITKLKHRDFIQSLSTGAVNPR